MLWLASMPVLNIYLAFPGFTYASIFFLLVLILALNSSKGFITIFKWPNSYLLFWIFVTFSFTVACVLHGSLYRAILPGGFAFCLFSLQLGFVTKFYDIKFFYKYSRIIAVITIVVLVFQDLFYLYSGHRFSALLPFGALTDGLPISELIQVQTSMDRSCSIFREPAHAAQFLLVVLALELFWKGRDKLYTNFGLFLGVGLLILRSGNGLLGMILLVAFKAFYYLKQNKSKYRFLVLTIGVICCLGVVSYYSKTELGAETMARVSEFDNNESSKSYIRIYRGFALLADSSFIVKLFGTNNDGILEIIHNSPVAYLFDGLSTESDLYFNGVSSIILHIGIIGFVLFCSYMIKCQKESEELPKALSVLLLVISFVGATYLSTLMLTVCIIVNGEYYRSKTKAQLAPRYSQYKNINRYLNRQ